MPATTEPMSFERAADEIRYWKARSAALDATVERLRQTLLALADVLPPRYVKLLEKGPEQIRAEAIAAPALITGCDPMAQLSPAHVATEMRRVWQRLGKSGDNA